MKLTTLEQKELVEVLSSFGLKEKEIAVYTSLLSHGATTLTPLARSTGLAVSTVESVLKRLHAEGLVVANKKKTRHVYEALDPITFKKILEKKIEEVATVLPLLQLLRSEKITNAAVRVYYRERFNDIWDKAM